jgi:hypothetical protein
MVMARKYLLPALQSQRLVGRSCVALALLLLYSALPSAEPSEWFGTWKLNLEKSVYRTGTPPYRRATMKVQPLDGDRVRFSYDFIYPRGGLQHVEWDGRFDGRDYMVQGADEYVTYAYRQTGARTYEITAKLDSRVTAVATATISADSRTITTSTRSADVRDGDVTSITVYEKASSDSTR